MPPKRGRGSLKRKAETQPPGSTRRSARLNPPESESSAPSTARAMSTQTGLSGFSTEPESSETWPDLARRAKERISQYERIPSLNDEKLVPCMDALLDYLPEGGRESIARDILSCETHEKLYEVFQNVRSCLLFAMKAAGNSSIHRSPIDKRKDSVELVASSLGDPQHREREFRDKVLRRDEFRCVITKDMEIRHWEEIGEPKGVAYSDLQAAHIIPFSIASWKDSPSASFDASAVWEMLWRCFPRVRQVGMKVDNINDPSNGISLRDSLHTQFGKFRLAFIPTTTPDTYQIKTYKSFPTYLRRDSPSDGIICFTKSGDADDVPLPNKVFLDCHYRVAEILNASGMGEEIEKKIGEWEYMKMDVQDENLAEDGTTDISRFLRAAFWARVEG